MSPFLGPLCWVFQLELFSRLSMSPQRLALSSLRLRGFSPLRAAVLSPALLLLGASIWFGALDIDVSH